MQTFVLEDSAPEFSFGKMLTGITQPLKEILEKPVKKSAIQESNQLGNLDIVCEILGCFITLMNFKIF